MLPVAESQVKKPAWLVNRANEITMACNGLGHLSGSSSGDGTLLAVPSPAPRSGILVANNTRLA